MEALSGLEHLEFDQPFGRLEAYYTDGLGSLILTMPGRVTGTLEEKTLRYPGFAERLALLRDCGMLQVEPVEVGGVSVSPLDVLARQLRAALTLGPDGDLLALRTVVTGERGGARSTWVFELLDRFDTATRTTAMGRTTGFPAALAARMIADGRIAEPGVWFPETLFVGALGRAFVAALRDRGLAITEREES